MAEKLKYILRKNAPSVYLALVRLRKGDGAALAQKTRLHWETLARAGMSNINAQKVASARFGPGSQITSSKTLNLGRFNNGIFVHEVSNSEGKTRGCFVEKLTTNPIEAALAACTMRVCGTPDDVFAQIYSIGSEDGFYRIFMEYIGGIGAQLSLDGSYAPHLAAALVRLNEQLEFLRCRFSLEFPTSSVKNKIKKLCFMELEKPDDEMKVRSIVSEIASVLYRYPMILSHDDVHRQNIGRAERAGHEHDVFIDFGMVKYNIPGAELQFFCQFERRDENRLFFEALSQEYSKLMDIPLPVIQMGAFFQASHRVLHENQRKGMKRPHERPLRLLKHARRALHERPLK